MPLKVLRTLIAFGTNSAKRLLIISIVFIFLASVRTRYLLELLYLPPFFLLLPRIVNNNPQVSVDNLWIVVNNLLKSLYNSFRRQLSTSNVDNLCGLRWLFQMTTPNWCLTSSMTKVLSSEPSIGSWPNTLRTNS